ncbi:hypothetical protein [Burkholderia ubonensis]|uniref:hypothetical protein n=1 Tax=Burkholderia ubonensis TaxID=101571 RepID=UPI0012FAB2E4|nr:hypothetical protein [Burkholderia ubonensis]
MKIRIRRYFPALDFPAPTGLARRCASASTGKWKKFKTQFVERFSEFLQRKKSMIAELLNTSRINIAMHRIKIDYIHSI